MRADAGIPGRAPSPLLPIDHLPVIHRGIGGAIVSEGRLLRGERGLAGELGHLVVDIDGPECGCGARGHLEGICSGSGIARAASARLGRPVSAAEVAAAEEAGGCGRCRLVDLGDPLRAALPRGS